jgi:spore coat-associated protein N
MPTGFWAPSDKHTRGLFLKYTGSLEAKLATLKVLPTDASGTVQSTGAQYYDDVLFANQARVKIWDIKKYDPSGGTVPYADMSPRDMDLIMDLINDVYSANPGADDRTLLNAVNEQMLTELNRGDVSHFQVDKMYDRALIDLVNAPLDVHSVGITVAPGDAGLLAFTVEFDKNPNVGVDPNAMQDKSVYFNFGTDWTQARNN